MKRDVSIDGLSSSQQVVLERLFFDDFKVTDGFIGKGNMKKRKKKSKKGY